MNELPAKWCVKWRQEVGDWFCINRDKGASNDYDKDGYKNALMHYPHYNSGHYTYHSSYNIKPEYTEISFETFERLVLNKQEQVSYTIY